MEIILNFISNILAAILPTVFGKKEISEYERQYEKFRYDVAAALTMYARYYHSPVDLARQLDHALPPEYEMASTELRKLGSTARALAETIPNKGKKFPISKDDLISVSGNLIGLSNSMCTPYNCGTSLEDRDAVREYEAEIRKLLCIEKNAL